MVGGLMVAVELLGIVVAELVAAVGVGLLAVIDLVVGRLLGDL